MNHLVFAGQRPRAVYLARVDDYAEAVPAAALQHFPVNGPLILAERDQIPPEVKAEIARLNPTGAPGSAQVVLVGRLGPTAELQVRALGFSVERIAGADPFETAYLIAARRSFPPDIQLISPDPHTGGFIAASWSAHMSDPILFTGRSHLPEATRRAIRATKNPRVYVIGSGDFLSKQVEEEFYSLGVGFLDRIGGRDLFELSVNFARYRSPVNDYGWGRDYRGGHAFSFTLVGEWPYLVSSTPLSHMGKHTPFLFVRKDTAPPAITSYIESVNPMTMDRPPFMHGFIVGSTCLISRHVQEELHRALSIDERGHM